VFETQGLYLVTRDVRESDVALWKGAKRHGGYTTSEAELEPSFFTFTVSTVATSPSTRVLGLVAKALTTRLMWPTSPLMPLKPIGPARLMRPTRPVWQARPIRP
jgi:hypothetical protein